MAFYAVDDDDLIYAGEAEPGKTYWCLDCFGPVKRRRGKGPFPHFYHLRAAPQCRLYSKTEDHLLAQLQLQKQFPPGTLQMERPFIKINRVADLCWENEKIVFEIQCSPLTPKEAEMRIGDYRSHGYEVVWLLDDKRYNKRLARPAEEFLRAWNTYYVAIRQNLYYDQFEIFAQGRRMKRGRRMPIELQAVRRRPQTDFDEELFPKQILQLQTLRYFQGDRIDRALRVRYSPYYKLAMQNWRALEALIAEQTRKPSRWKQWLWLYVGQPYRMLLEYLLKKAR